MSDGGSRVAELATAAELRAASGDHPFLRFDLATTFEPPALHLTGSEVVAWFQVWGDGRRGVVVLGADDGVAHLAATDMFATWVAAKAPNHVTAPATAYEPVRDALGLRGGNAWDRMWTTTPPPTLPAERDITWFDGDPAELTAFIKAHNPHPFALPGQHEGMRWAALRDKDARLIACGVSEPGNTDVPLIGGIVADSTLRGRGLGAAMTAYLTRDGIDRTGASTLGVFADNDHARVLYERLGYATSLRARTGFPL
ncbi:acetyltransferase (GNAT) family protein [Knoellia remsis]|uniref:Acetyltransferase (GNAT) family protein n=1 Tax=Knoellia remsis TaxID=407159 RepID=A0A2T0V183_9MICO|nr:GNAT family N-acetyltransferase [Knoellia remsis]PRY63838.1 acetyltransferase (GNAT) family protein [Knoellia remsis]